jgi:hypothetical protein
MAGKCNTTAVILNAHQQPLATLGLRIVPSLWRQHQTIYEGLVAARHNCHVPFRQTDESSMHWPEAG